MGARARRRTVGRSGYRLRDLRRLRLEGDPPGSSWPPLDQDEERDGFGASLAADQTRVSSKESGEAVLRFLSIEGSANDGFVGPNDYGALKQAVVPRNHVDDGLGVADVVVLFQAQFLELAVLSNESFDRVFELANDGPQGGLIGEVLHVGNFFEFDTHLRGDRHSVGRRVSMRVVVDRELSHMTR